MFQSNTTGLPNPDDYVIGRGRLFLAPIDAINGRPLGFRFVGNAPSFSWTVATETLEHKASTGGLKTIDKEVVTEVTTTVSFGTDEVNGNNLNDFLLGAIDSSATNAAKVGFASREVAAAGTVAAGRSYDIVNAAGDLAIGASEANVTVTLGGTPLALGVDYSFDYEKGTATSADSGQVFLLASSATVAANVAGALDIGVSADASLPDLTRIEGLENTSKTYALLFVAENPADNDNIGRIEFHKISLKPDGEYQGIGDDWAVLAFTGKAEKNNKLNGRTMTCTAINKTV